MIDKKTANFVINNSEVNVNMEIFKDEPSIILSLSESNSVMLQSSERARSIPSNTLDITVIGKDNRIRRLYDLEDKCGISFKLKAKSYASPKDLKCCFLNENNQ